MATTPRSSVVDRVGPLLGAAGEQQVGQLGRARDLAHLGEVLALARSMRGTTRRMTHVSSNLRDDRRDDDEQHLQAVAEQPVADRFPRPGLAASNYLRRRPSGEPPREEREVSGLSTPLLSERTRYDVVLGAQEDGSIVM